MSGAGAGRPSPAKLRRLEGASETDPTVVSTRRETSPPAGGRGEGGGARAPAAASGHAHCAGATAPPGGGLETTASLGGGLKTTGGPKGRLETDVTPCLEQGKGGLETAGEVTGSLETTSEFAGSLETSNGRKGSLETAVTRCLEQGKGSLETTREVTGSLETTGEVTGNLKTTSVVTGSLKTSNGRKGSLETAVTRCLGQGKGSLETTSEVTGSLETTSEVMGSLETNGHKGSLETTVIRRLEQGKGDLETTNEVTGSLKTTSEVMGSLKTTNRRKGSLETAVTRCLEQGRKSKGGLETATELKECLETTTIACSQQSRGEKRVPEPKGGPAPGVRQKGHSPEECAVISLGEDEEEEEEEEGPRRYLAALEAVQLELEAVEEQAARAFRRLRAKFWLRRRPHLQRRNRLIQHIPGFWVTAFLNHPQLSAMISDRDEDALSYMTSLQVEEFGQARPGCRIRFFFSVNPYFQNDVVAKEFVRGPSGHLVSHSTPIRWWQGQDPRSRPHKGPPAPRSFFAWFGDHSFPAGDRIAEIIKEELWPNPLQFYLLGEGAEGIPESESGEDCVVIVDDDEDVQEILDDGDGK
ncbi:PREDICTED: testis-specific Y-encoded-like protein 2 [Haliaeetus leucocephalus]|uniref:testis-specific Y-encoded-like protein 2 n=1 Tax=Haliaeetus leucocephalus TaxID=52644 RepID=UPI00053CD64C|nr:PREDICTED: testis-specific Y-encoded-like protein 2 [Haliaeetus leucocephalus]